MPLAKRLQDTEPFSSLPPEALEKIRSTAEVRTFPAGSFIVRQNELPTGFLYIIQEGLVEITVVSPGGVEMVVDYRQEGSFFGGTPIFTGEPYTAGARTVRPTTCFLVPEHVLKGLERTHPSFRDHFTRIAFSRVRRLYREIVTEHGRDGMGQMEAFPFKKRLSEIMVAPVQTCGPELPIREVARRMVDVNIGSVLVISPGQEPLGIVTERDLVARIVVPENDWSRLNAGDIMRPAPHGLPPETFMYEAMAYMNAHRIKYLPVVDRREVVGIVSVRDLMRYRSQKAMLLIGNIREEESLEGLATVRREIVNVARSLLSETRSTPEVMEILSYIHHRIIRRVYELCRQELEAQGLKPPPVRHCLLILGSGARREMLLAPDQDHALIYEDVPEERRKEIDAYFAPLAKHLVGALERVGYPPCPGQVMVTQPRWRGTLQDWKARLRDWVNEPEPRKVRYSSIFFDFAPVAGDPSLAQDLRDVIHRSIREFPAFLYHMMSLDLRTKVPLGLLNRFVVERAGPHQGQLSLKHGGTVYIVDCIRMFALEKELSAISTLGRLEGLVRHNLFSPETAEHIRAAFEALNFLRLRNEIALADQGREPASFLDPHQLSRTEQDLLREAFQAVSRLQEAAKRHFGRTPF